MQPKKVVIGIPNEGHVSDIAYDNHLALSFHLGRLEATMEYKPKLNPLKNRYEFYWHTVGRILTPMAREKLIASALQMKADYILMYDDDMILPIDMVEFMLKDMEEHPEIDILAPLAFMRNVPHYAVIYTTTEGYDEVRRSAYHVNNFYLDWPRDQLIECDAVGFGAVLINMRIFKDMKPPYCFSTTGAGEDLYLCFKAKKEANARIFMDTRVKLGHIGRPAIVDEEYHDKWTREHRGDEEEPETTGVAR